MEGLFQKFMLPQPLERTSRKVFLYFRTEFWALYGGLFDNPLMKEEDKFEFKQKIQEAFGIAVAENFGPTEPIPSDKELEEDFAEPDNVSLVILNNGKKIGGAIVKINPETQRNSLELFFIYAGIHGKGLWLAAWKAIEARSLKQRFGSP